jgi:hypothetical protein
MDDRSVCESDGAILEEIDSAEAEDLEDTDRLPDGLDFDDTTTKRVANDSELGLQGMRPVLEMELATSVDDGPPAAVLELDARAEAKRKRAKPIPDPDEALKPLPIAAPRSGDHELDDDDETAPVDGPTNVLEADVPTLVDDPDSELSEQLVAGTPAPDPLPPIRDADRIIAAAQRRVASKRIQHQLKQLKTGQLAPKPPEARLDRPTEEGDNVAGFTDEGFTDEGVTEESVTRESVARESVARKSVARKSVARESVPEESGETTPIVVPTTKRDAEDDTVKVPAELASTPSRKPASTEKVTPLVVEEEPSQVVPLSRALPTEIAVPLPPPRPSSALYWVTLIIVALACLGIGFVLGRASI